MPPEVLYKNTDLVGSTSLVALSLSLLTVLRVVMYLSLCRCVEPTHFVLCQNLHESTNPGALTWCWLFSPEAHVRLHTPFHSANALVHARSCLLSSAQAPH